MNPDMSLKPPAEGYILSPLALARRTKKLQAAFAANPAWKLGDLEKKVIHSFLQHYLALKLPKAKIAQLMNDQFNTTFTVGAVIGFADRRGLVVYNDSHAIGIRPGTAARIAAVAVRKEARAAAAKAMAQQKETARTARITRRQEREAKKLLKIAPSATAVLARVAAKLPPEPVVQPGFVGLRYPLLLIRDGQCREITGLGKKDNKVLCCGQATGSPRKSYCSIHRKLNLQPVTGRNRPASVERISKFFYYEGFEV